MGQRYVYTLEKPVFFVGFMGAGKTTLARRLARSLGLASADIDRSIERDAGYSIKQLFGMISVEEFRAMEAEKLRTFCAMPPMLISCGGGLVEGEESRRIIAENGFCVHMYVHPEESAERISNHDTRPYFDTMDSVREVGKRRLPLYEQVADATVDTTGKTPAIMSTEVRSLLMKEGILCRTPK